MAGAVNFPGDFQLGTGVGQVPMNERAIDARIRAASAIDGTITIDDSVSMSERTQLSGGKRCVFIVSSRAR